MTSVRHVCQIWDRNTLYSFTVASRDCHPSSNGFRQRFLRPQKNRSREKIRWSGRMSRTPCKLAREDGRSREGRRLLSLNVSCRSLALAVRTGLELLCCLCQRDKPVPHTARTCRYRESVIETSAEGQGGTFQPSHRK